MTATAHESALRVFLARRNRWPHARFACRAHIAALRILQLEGQQ